MVVLRTVFKLDMEYHIWISTILYYVYYLDDTKYKQKLIITLFLLTSYSYFTYAIFWVWFVVMNFESINKFKKRIVNC